MRQLNAAIKAFNDTAPDRRLSFRVERGPPLHGLLDFIIL
jgi:hypothetical protein